MNAQYQPKPVGVTLISILFFLSGAMGMLGGFSILAVPIPAADPISGLLASYQIVIGVVGILIGGLQIAVGWGLWMLQNWARIAAITLLALSAISNLMSGVGLLLGIEVMNTRVALPGAGIALVLMAAIEGFIIWYLLKFDIAALFTGMGIAPALTIAAVVQPVPPISLPPVPPVATAPVASPRPQFTAGQVPAREPTMPIGVPAQPVAWLVARTGGHAGRSFGLKVGNNTVGRDPHRADVVLDEPTISGEHARVRCEGGQFYVYDLASTNGTFVNNRPVQRQMLMDNDVVRFGSAELVFKKA